jgi:SAM-dependent methyltransferase
VHALRAQVCDINEEMLRVGMQRAEELGEGRSYDLDWVTADAEALPFDDGSFDAVTISFGIRNVTRIDRALRSACVCVCVCACVLERSISMAAARGDDSQSQRAHLPPWPVMPCACLPCRETRRVLKRGGRFMCLEFGPTLDHAAMDQLYKLCEPVILRASYILQSEPSLSSATRGGVGGSWRRCFLSQR